MRKLHGFSVLIAAAALTAAATITAFAGWSEQNGRWYYYNDRNGELVRNEWVEDGGKWYFMDDEYIDPYIGDTFEFDFL